MSAATTRPSTAPSSADCLVSEMTLRDWFAGQALTGMIPAPKQPGVPMLNMEGMAKAAYEYADALIKRRALANGG